MEAVLIAVVVGVCLLNCEVCRAARLEAEAGLPLLKEARNCAGVARGNLLQRSEVLEDALYPRDSGRVSWGGQEWRAVCACVRYASN